MGFGYFILSLPMLREKSIWPEKAHSSLCSLLVNLDNSLCDVGMKERKVAFIVVLAYIYAT